jgi:hypothetical protein
MMQWPRLLAIAQADNFQTLSYGEMLENQSVLRMLEYNQIPECYRRNIAAIGIGWQKHLLGAKVAIVGAGGLEGTVVEILT